MYGPNHEATLGSYPCSSIVRTPQTIVPTVSLKTSFPRIPIYPAGYPHGSSTTPMGSHPCAWPLSLATKRCRMPRNTFSGSHWGTFAQGLPKNGFSLGTHQAGRVPTWSLYNTHGVAPLCLAPFLGYTGFIPLLFNSQNTPRLLYPQSP